MIPSSDREKITYNQQQWSWAGNHNSSHSSWCPEWRGKRLGCIIQLKWSFKTRVMILSSYSSLCLSKPIWPSFFHANQKKMINVTAECPSCSFEWWMMTMDNFRHTKLSESFRWFKIQPGWQPGYHTYIFCHIGLTQRMKNKVSNCSSKVFNEKMKK